MVFLVGYLGCGRIYAKGKYRVFFVLYLVWVYISFRLDSHSFLPPFFFPAWFFFLLVRGVEDAFSPSRIRIRTTTTTSQVLDCMECYLSNITRVFRVRGVIRAEFL